MHENVALQYDLFVIQQTLSTLSCSTLSEYGLRTARKISSPFKRHNLNRRLRSSFNRRKHQFKILTVVSVLFLMFLSI